MSQIFSVGRVCVKLAGRDAGLKCVIVEEGDGQIVLVDGQTRRRNVNTRHLEPLGQVLELSAGADHAAVVSALKGINVEVATRNAKSVAQRPRASRASSVKAASKTPKAAKARDAASSSSAPSKDSTKEAAADAKSE